MKVSVCQNFAMHVRACCIFAQQEVMLCYFLTFNRRMWDFMDLDVQHNLPNIKKGQDAAGMTKG